MKKTMMKSINLLLIALIIMELCTFSGIIPILGKNGNGAYAATLSTNNSVNETITEDTYSSDKNYIDNKSMSIYTDALYTLSKPDVFALNDSEAIPGVMIDEAVTAELDESTTTTRSAVVISYNSVTGIRLNKQTTDINSGYTEKLTAIVSPENATNKKVIWSSSNNDVAIVDQNGVVTAVNEGTVKITVTTVDGSKKAICNVTVNSVVRSVTINSAVALTEESYSAYQYTTLLGKYNTLAEAKAKANSYDYTYVLDGSGKEVWRKYYSAYQNTTLLGKYNTLAEAKEKSGNYEQGYVLDGLGKEVWRNLYLSTSYMQQIAILCSASYYTNFTKGDANNINKWLLAQGKYYNMSDWVYVDSYESATGFRVLLAYNQKRNECVIAFRGSIFDQGMWDLYKSGMTDLVEVGWGISMNQVSDAEYYVQEAVKSVTAVIPNAKIVLAGHSLGGYLAAYAASDIQDGINKVNNFIGAYTFNSPGINTNIHPIKALKCESYRIKNFNINDDVVHKINLQLGSSIPLGSRFGSWVANHAISNFYENKQFYSNSNFVGF